MNLTIYLEDAIAKKLDQCAKQSGSSHNVIICEALKEWLQHHEAKKWNEDPLER